MRDRHALWFPRHVKLQQTESNAKHADPVEASAATGNMLPGSKFVADARRPD
jgi:hypothetical protein